MQEQDLESLGRFREELRKECARLELELGLLRKQHEVAVSDLRAIDQILNRRRALLNQADDMPNTLPLILHEDHAAFKTIHSEAYAQALQNLVFEIEQSVEETDEQLLTDEQMAEVDQSARGLLAARKEKRFVLFLMTIYLLRISQREHLTARQIVVNLPSVLRNTYNADTVKATENVRSRLVSLAYPTIADSQLTYRNGLFSLSPPKSEAAGI